MRTIVYIDGFNLYFRMLRQRPKFKWLDLLALSRRLLASGNVIERVNYYTAHVSGRLDAAAPARQHAYLSALATVPEIAIHYGKFLVTDKWAGLVHPPEARPSITIPPPWPDVVRVVKVEEKGSDVNLASHLIRDAYTTKFDVAAVLSNDTDLVEPIRIVRQEVGKEVGIIAPVARPAADLLRVASFVRHIRPGDLQACQFPDPIPGFGVRRPATWA
jgi:uncharacterized LabA/DUF88 family protein